MPVNHRDLWDTKYVKSELTSHAMSDGKSFLYFLAITGFDWLQFTVIRLFPPPGTVSAWGRADALSTLLITFLGLAFLFWCNGGANGKDFLYRYFSLSFVVGWKFMVSLSIVLWLVGLALQDGSEPTLGWTSTIILAVFNFAMFVRIGLHMRELSCANPAG